MEKDYESIVNRIHNIEEKLEHGPVTTRTEQNLQPASGKEVVEVPPKQIMESAVPGEVKSLAGNWHQVLNQLDPVSKNMLNHVTLTVDDTGALVIAFQKIQHMRISREKGPKREAVSCGRGTYRKEDKH